VTSGGEERDDHAKAELLSAVFEPMASLVIKRLSPNCISHHHARPILNSILEVMSLSTTRKSR
jgi:hypothetical protein